MMQEKPATPRVLRAVELRDAALKVIRAIGIDGGGPIGIEAESLGIKIAARKWPPKLHHQLLTYGLDVWTPKAKVLNINWDDDGRIVLITFKRGEWEARLLSAPFVGSRTTH